MFDVGVDDLLERHLLGPLVVDGQHVDAEGRLELGELEELVDDHLRAGIALEFDFHTGFLVGKVAHARNAGEHLVADQLGDTLLQHRTVHAVRDLADDDHRLAALTLLDLHLAAQAHGTAAGLEVTPDAADATDFAGHREVRALDVGHQFLEGDLGVVDLGADAVDHFAQVVGGEVGGHADRNAGAAIDQEVGEAGGEHGRLFLRAVVVGLEVDGVLVEVFHHRHAEVVQAGLGITHGGRGVAFDRAEVTLAVHKHVAHRPGLTHVDQGGVDG